MGWGLAFLAGVTAAFCLGGPLAFAQQAKPIDPPDPKRMVVTARPVGTHEFIVYDPISVNLGSDRPLPEAIALPPQRRIALTIRLGSIYVALPLRMRAIVSARMEPIDIAVPEPRRIRTGAEKDDIYPPMPDQRAVNIGLYITPAKLEMPAMRRLGTDVRRLRPETVLITEPLAMSAAIQRRTAPVFARYRK